MFLRAMLNNLCFSIFYGFLVNFFQLYTVNLKSFQNTIKYLKSNVQGSIFTRDAKVYFNKSTQVTNSNVSPKNLGQVEVCNINVGS